MRAKLLVFMGLAAVFLGPTQGLTQFPGGGGPPGGRWPGGGPGGPWGGGSGNPWSGGGPGGFGGGRLSFGGGDPNAFFDMMSGGKDVLVRSELDPRWQRMFDRIAESTGNTSGRITRQQYAAYTQQRLPGGGPSSGPAAAPPVVRMEMRGGPGGFSFDGLAEMIFRRADQNGDGLLNFDEMPESLRAEREKWDANRDGFVDTNEFKGYMDGRRQQMMADRGLSGPGQSSPGSWSGWLEEPERRRLPQEDRRPVVYRTGKLPQNLPGWFVEMDFDKDAQVGLYEWKSSSRSIDEFQKLDRNADGFLTVEEVLRSVAQAKTSPGSDANGGRGSIFAGPPMVSFGGDSGRGGFRPGGPGGNSDRSNWWRERGGPGGSWDGRERGGFGRGPGSEGRERGGFGRWPGEGRERSRGDR